MADTLSNSEKAHGRLIADGDLCTECYYLIHYPGRLSLCSRLIGTERWPVPSARTTTRFTVNALPTIGDSDMPLMV